MGRVVITAFDEVAPGAFPALQGVSAQGAIETRGVIAGPDRGLLLWMHELRPGVEIRWSAAPVDHLAYVWAGDVEVDGKRVETDGAAIVEHGASAVLRAGPRGATLAHFHSREDGPEPPRRAGGHVHLAAKEGIFKSGTSTVLADSACPTCEVWLHRSEPTKPRPQNNRHLHTEDEIVVIAGGGMILGRRTIPPRTAIAIDVDTIYSFGVPEGGLATITFRATDPHQVRLSAKNEPLSEPMAMRDIMRNRLES